MKQRRALGKTGLEVSPLGYGAAPIGYLGTDQKQVEQILDVLAEGGVNVIDTAACYEGSEQVLGAILGPRRRNFVIVSKCGHIVEGVDGPEWSPSLIAQSVDRSLRRLRTEHVDVMLLHSCDLSVLERGEAVTALAKAREEGKVRFIGYSGDNEAAAYAAALPEMDVIETSINVCDQANLESVLPPAQERQLGMIAKRPIANAAWKQSQPGLYAEYARPYAERLREMNVRPADLGFDGAPDEVWPEIALRFTLSLPGVHTAITGSTKPENVRANLAILDKGPLPQDVTDKIRNTFQQAAARARANWRGLT